MTIFFGTVRSTNDNAWKPAKWNDNARKAAKWANARSHEITNKQLRVRSTKTLWLPTWKTNYNAEKCASDVKKRKIGVNRISKVRQTTCNWKKKILNEATIIIVNVFLISWFFYLFWSCSEALVNTIRASSFIENFPQISTKPIAFQRNLLGKLPWKSAVLYQSFFSETGLENSCENPAKSAIFSANLFLKIPRNLTFFSATYQKPWLWHNSISDLADKNRKKLL